MSKFFTSRKIFDNVTQIGGLGGELCYLVEGSEKALLIDGLTGVGSLKAFVRECTDLPVTLVLTHGHVDHAGASFEYGECYVNPADVALLYEHGDIDKRYGFVMGGGKPEGAFVPKKEDVVPPCAVKTLPVQDGDVFDLGGVQIEAIAVPGHTVGTMVYLDRARRVLYSGDACNANTLLGLPCSTTVETYAKSLDHLATYLKGVDKFYGGHGLQAVPAYIVDEALILCEEILSDDDDRFETEFLGRKFLYARKFDGMFHREDGGIANIAYVMEKVYNK